MFIFNCSLLREVLVCSLLKRQGAPGSSFRSQELKMCFLFIFNCKLIFMTNFLRLFLNWKVENDFLLCTVYNSSMYWILYNEFKIFRLADFQTSSIPENKEATIKICCTVKHYLICKVLNRSTISLWVVELGAYFTASLTWVIFKLKVSCYLFQSWTIIREGLAHAENLFCSFIRHKYPVYWYSDGLQSRAIYYW